MNKLLLIICFLYSMAIFGQNVISGNIHSNDNKPVKSAIITLFEAGNNSEISYSITDEKGNFKIVYQSVAKKIELRIKAYGYKTIARNYDANNQTVDIALEDQTTEIKEVVLAKRMISQKGDTISFDTASFSQKNDRTLEDILKNMPGVEVGVDGKIKYQGKELNKFYVENKDLVGGSYGLITKSLPKSDVSKVEIYENHQPIKALEGKNITNSPALNIKLKNNVTVTGTGIVGSGFTDPWLWNIKLTPMLFTKKYQALFNYKTNNIGESVENEVKGLVQSDDLEAEIDAPVPTHFLSVETAPVPPLALKRYLMNNVHSLSANYLGNINENWEMRVKLNFMNNWISQSAIINTVYPNAVTVRRNPAMNNYSNEAQGEIRLSKNTSKSYITNTLGWAGSWDKNNALGNRLNSDYGVQTSFQNIYSPFNGFQNSFSTILPLKKAVLNITSYIGYKNESQSLMITPADYSFTDQFNAGEAKSLNQTFNKSGFNFRNSVFLKYTLGKWKITPEIKSEVIKDNITTYLYKNTTEETPLGNEYSNKNTWVNFISSAILAIDYIKNENFNLNFQLPLSNVNADFTDNIRNITTKSNHFTFNPSANLFWRFKNYYNVNANISHGKFYGLENSIFLGKILSTPISMMVQDSPLPEFMNTKFYMSLGYRNTADKIFATAEGSYSINKTNIINKIAVSESGNDTQVLPYSNRSENLTSGFKVSKYISALRMNSSIKYEFNNNKGYYYYNMLNESKSNAHNVSFILENSYLSWFNVNYILEYNARNVQNITKNTSTDFQNWKHNLKFYFYFLKSNILNINIDSELNKNENQTFRNNFYDIVYTYTWTKKNIDFELSWLNIFNTKEYNLTTVNDDLSIVKSTYFIRPRQVMLSVRFNFK